MKIDRKYSKLLFALFMSLGMAFVISLILVSINVGFSPDFFKIWIRGFATGWVIGFPTALVIIPLVKRTVDKLTS